MSVSDQRFAAQVRDGTSRPRVHIFDDIGCAVTWLEKQTWKDHPDTKIWVLDAVEGTWLDARTAWFESVQISPMGYNLIARRERTRGAVDYASAVRKINETEKQRQFNEQ